MPPATKTFPLGKRVAVCCSRAAFMEVAVVHPPVAGLYISTLDRTLAPSNHSRDENFAIREQRRRVAGTTCRHGIRRGQEPAGADAIKLTWSISATNTHRAVVFFQTELQNAPGSSDSIILLDFM